MLAPAATAKRMASEPEWWNVPSPRFWTKCSASVNGCMPTNWAPSPPICVRPVTVPLPSGESRTIVWQPIPTPSSVSSGLLVELLCGQPEQKNGVRASGSAARAGGVRRASMASTRARTPSSDTRRSSRAATASAIVSASRSDSAGSSGLPTTSGWSGPP